jgi:hypothetical protein
MTGHALPPELVLATRGQPAPYAIVRAAGASPSQIYASEELQAFTLQMTGVTLPIVTDDQPLPPKAVLLGDTRYTEKILGQKADLRDLGDDGFRLKTCPPHLLILGGPVRGTLYGVYDLLEKQGGCRWYSSWHSVIPSHAVWKIPALDNPQKPAFAMREPFWFDMFDGNLAVRNKANGNAMRLEAKHGGKVRFGGGLFVHTFNLLMPVAEFIDAHPEYFSEIDGKRIRERPQLCLSNPEVLKILTARVLERIRKDPQAKLFSVSQNDWYNPCACPLCKAIDDREGSHAGSLLAFVNQVAEKVEQEFPDVWIETLAYQYTRKPPLTIRPRSNVVVRLCTIECDFSKPLDKSAFEENKKFVDEIRTWSGLTDKLFIWDYVTDFSHYTAPFPNFPALQGNVQFFRNNHVVGLFEQGAYQGRHAEFAELKAWLLAHWLWNPELPAEPLLKDFFAGYYGPGAPFVRAYFDELQTFYAGSNEVLRIWADPSKGPIPDAFYVKAAGLWKQAEEVTRGTPYAYNVRMGAIPVLYARFTRLPPVEGTPPPDYRALAADLLARFKEAKDIFLSEDSNLHKNQVDTWTRWTAP